MHPDACNCYLCGPNSFGHKPPQSIDFVTLPNNGPGVDVTQIINLVREVDELRKENKELKQDNDKMTLTIEENERLLDCCDANPETACGICRTCWIDVDDTWRHENQKVRRELILATLKIDCAAQVDFRAIMENPEDHQVNHCGECCVCLKDQLAVVNKDLEEAKDNDTLWKRIKSLEATIQLIKNSLEGIDSGQLQGMDAFLEKIQVKQAADTALTCRKRHVGSQWYCQTKCVGCGHTCQAHYYDGVRCTDPNDGKGCACTWVDPNPREAWQAGYVRGMASVELELSRFTDTVFDRDVPEPGKD